MKFTCLNLQLQASATASPAPSHTQKLRQQRLPNAVARRPRRAIDRQIEFVRYDYCRNKHLHKETHPISLCTLMQEDVFASSCT